MRSPSADAEFLRTVSPGTRVVARYRIEGGFTDALGYLRSCDGGSCTIETRRHGMVTVRFADVVAAKQVPEPPVRRPGEPAPISRSTDQPEH